MTATMPKNMLVLEIHTDQGCYGLDAMLEHQFVPEYCLTFIVIAVIDGRSRSSTYVGLPWSSVRASVQAALPLATGPVHVVVVAAHTAETMVHEAWMDLDENGRDMRYNPEYYGDSADGTNGEI
jgi:hypothetical protein